VQGDQEPLWRLERVAEEVKGRQLAVLGDSGMVETGELTLLPVEGKLPGDRAGPWEDNGAAETQPAGKWAHPGMAIKGDGDEMHYRKFKIVLTISAGRREVLSLIVTKPIGKESCNQLLDVTQDDIDTQATFWADYCLSHDRQYHLTTANAVRLINSIERYRRFVAYFPAPARA
jgi:hypothetical protein